MTMKRTDLEKNKALKLRQQLRGTAIPDRFAAGSTELLSRREQRKRDAEANLLPFACKLPADLVERLRAEATRQGKDLNALLTELLSAALPAQS